MLKQLALLIPSIRRLYEDRDRLLRESQPAQKLLACMRRCSIDLVLDVGANEGQFASSLRSAGYIGKLISFEPLSAAFSALTLKCDQDTEWECHKLAIGDRDGEAIINLSANSVSSSLLAAHRRTVAMEAGIAYVGKEMVALRRLDTLLPELTQAQRIFLKVDTQGFERSVIEGARAMLNRVVMAQMELAWTPSYEGQDTMVAIVETMKELGLEPALVTPAWTEEATRLILEIDLAFIRPFARTPVEASVQ